MCQCDLSSAEAFCGAGNCVMPAIEALEIPTNIHSVDKVKWRVSSSGMAVVKGGFYGERVVLYSFPEAVKGISGRESVYQLWLLNAENLCEMVNDCYYKSLAACLKNDLCEGRQACS